MAPVRAVWGYPLNASRAVRKGNDDTMIGSYSSDENKSGEGNPCCTVSEEMNAPTALMAATADLNAHETDTIRPIGLNDFRKYSSVRAVLSRSTSNTRSVPFSSHIFSSLFCTCTRTRSDRY